MKIRKSFLYLILAALMLGGCEKEEVQESGYQIYYTDEEGERLQSQTYIPEKEDTDELVDQMMKKWTENSEDQQMISAKPEEVELLSYEIQKRKLVVDFNAAYRELSNTEEIMLRASLSKTMLQIPGIQSVQITIDGEKLTDRMGKVIPGMTDKSFVDVDDVGVDGFETIEYPFYFADDSGNLEEEKRIIHYSSSSEKLQTVLKQLIAGTKNSNLNSVIAPDTKVLSSKIENGLCTVNFSKKFNYSVDNVLPDTSIYTIVNTLCGLNGVTSVKINIEGDTESYYLDTIDLSVPFERREDLIKTTTEEDEEDRVGVDYLMRKVTQEETEEDTGDE